MNGWKLLKILFSKRCLKNKLAFRINVVRSINLSALSDVTSFSKKTSLQSSPPKDIETLEADIAVICIGEFFLYDQIILMNIQVKRVTIINIEIELDHISQYTTVKHNYDSQRLY